MVISDDLVTVAEAAKILHRSIEQVRRYLREGKLQGQRIGQQWFIPKSALRTKGSRYEEMMALLEEIRKTREAIARRTGLVFDGAELVRQSREERSRELESRLP